MKTLLRQGSVGALLLAVALLFVPARSPAQDAASARKIVVRTAAIYPDLARNLALEGIVKVDALVGPDGTVKSVNVRGGHPVLAQAASNTVRSWKWEPATRESHETVEIRFSRPE